MFNFIKTYNQPWPYKIFAVLRKIISLAIRTAFFYPAILIGIMTMYDGLAQIQAIHGGYVLKSLQYEAHRWQDAPPGKVLTRVCPPIDKASPPPVPGVLSCPEKPISLSELTVKKGQEAKSLWMVAIILSNGIAFVLYFFKMFTNSFFEWYSRRKSLKAG